MYVERGYAYDGNESIAVNEAAEILGVPARP